MFLWLVTVSVLADGISKKPTFSYDTLKYISVMQNEIQNNFHQVG